MIKRSNLKLYTFVVFTILNILLFLLIQVDQVRNKGQYFLKPNSPYYTQFQSTLEGREILNFWEKDLTRDNKPEFALLTRKNNCSTCKALFSIYQGEKNIYEQEVDEARIFLQNGLFVFSVTNDNQETSYSWEETEFVSRNQTN